MGENGLWVQCHRYCMTGADLSRAIVGRKGGIWRAGARGYKAAAVPVGILRCQSRLAGRLMPRDRIEFGSKFQQPESSCDPHKTTLYGGLSIRRKCQTHRDEQGRAHAGPSLFFVFFSMMARRRPMATKTDGDNRAAR